MDIIKNCSLGNTVYLAIEGYCRIKTDGRMMDSANAINGMLLWMVMHSTQRPSSGESART